MRATHQKKLNPKSVVSLTKEERKPLVNYNEDEGDRENCIHISVTSIMCHYFHFPFFSHSIFKCLIFLYFCHRVVYLFVKRSSNCYAVSLCCCVSSILKAKNMPTIFIAFILLFLYFSYIFALCHYF